MKNNSKLWLLVVIALVIGGVFLLNDSFNDLMAAGGFSGSWSSDNEVPDITIYDEQGNACQLSDFRGKPVVLYFWGSWSEGTIEGMPAMNEFWQEYKDKVQFLFVCRPDGTKETEESARQFIADNGYEFPIYFDTDMTAATEIGFDSLPITFFIDSEGKCTVYGEGPAGLTDLQSAVVDILS